MKHEINLKITNVSNKDFKLVEKIVNGLDENFAAFVWSCAVIVSKKMQKEIK